MRQFPNMPVEEEGRLGDACLRENFIERLFFYQRWQLMQQQGFTIKKLTDFHACYKYNLMSHDQDGMRQLGRLLAGSTGESLEKVATDYIVLAMKILKKIATRKNHLNVLQHLQGYLKRELNADDKHELHQMFTAYKKGDVPLVVPVTLLKHHFRKCPDPYVENSYYLSPYPAELRLRNGI